MVFFVLFVRTRENDCDEKLDLIFEELIAEEDDGNLAFFVLHVILKWMDAFAV